MNKELLKYFIARKGATAGRVCEILGMDRSTYSRKLNGHSEFTHSEIKTLAHGLGLTGEEIVQIFFAEDVS